MADIETAAANAGPLAETEPMTTNPTTSAVVKFIDRQMGLDRPCAHWRVSAMIAAIVVVAVGFVGLIVGAVAKYDKAHWCMARFMRDAALPGLAIGLLVSCWVLVLAGKAKSNKTLILTSLGLSAFFLTMFGMYSVQEGHLYIGAA
jgi:uncharacterized membrane protein YozB (DUF420 family)